VRLMRRARLMMRARLMRRARLMQRAPLMRRDLNLGLALLPGRTWPRRSPWAFLLSVSGQFLRVDGRFSWLHLLFPRGWSAATPFVVGPLDKTPLHDVFQDMIRPIRHDEHLLNGRGCPGEEL